MSAKHPAAQKVVDRIITKTIGSLIDDIWAKREKKRALEAQLKLVEEDIAADEAKLLERMDKEGVDKSTGKKASVSISETIKPQTVDWDAFIAYVIKTKQGHLVERRPMATACRELWEQKGKIPGLEPFTQRRINVRTL